MFATRPTWPDDIGAELERLGDADGLHGHVDAETLGQVEQTRRGVLPPVVDRDVGA
jgi:hypothetical protein